MHPNKNVWQLACMWDIALPSRMRLTLGIIQQARLSYLNIIFLLLKYLNTGFCIRRSRRVASELLFGIGYYYYLYIHDMINVL